MRFWLRSRLRKRDLEVLRRDHAARETRPFSAQSRVCLPWGIALLHPETIGRFGMRDISLNRDIMLSSVQV